MNAVGNSSGRTDVTIALLDGALVSSSMQLGNDAHSQSRDYARAHIN